jgi:hypothetical protein
VDRPQTHDFGRLVSLEIGWRDRLVGAVLP